MRYPKGSILATDVRCAGCRALTTVDLRRMPPGDAPNHVESIVGQLQRLGWSGSRPCEMECPECSGATVALWE